jgi:hypothetical protein
MNRHEYTELRGAPRARPRLRLQQHLHTPTLEAVIEMLYQAEGVEGAAEAIRLVDAMRPPMEITTMGDLFGHVVDEGEMTPTQPPQPLPPQARAREREDAREHGREHAQEGYDDACEICGVRCASTGFAPHPGLCVRCTVKVQQLQKEKSPTHHEEYDEEEEQD